MLVLEYVFKPYLIDISKDDNLDSVFFDDPSVPAGHGIYVQPRTSEDGVLSVGGDAIRAKWLENAM